MGMPPYSEAFGIADIRVEPAPEEGFGADYAGTAVLTDLQYWRMEGFDCDFNWEDYRFIASGNEPFWRVVVSDSTVQLSQPDKEETFDLNVGSWPLKSVDGEFSLDAEQTICRDSMSGSVFGFTVTVILGDRVLKGCGHHGLL